MEMVYRIDVHHRCDSRLGLVGGSNAFPPPPWAFRSQITNQQFQITLRNQSGGRAYHVRMLVVNPKGTTRMALPATLADNTVVTEKIASTSAIHSSRIVIEWRSSQTGPRQKLVQDYRPATTLH